MLYLLDVTFFLVKLQLFKLVYLTCHLWFGVSIVDLFQFDRIHDFLSDKNVLVYIILVNFIHICNLIDLLHVKVYSCKSSGALNNL